MRYSFLVTFISLYALPWLLCTITGLTYAVAARCVEGCQKFEHQRDSKFFLGFAFCPVLNAIFGVLSVLAGIWMIVAAIIDFIATGKNPFKTFVKSI